VDAGRVRHAHIVFGERVEGEVSGPGVRTREQPERLRVFEQRRPDRESRRDIRRPDRLPLLVRRLRVSNRMLREAPRERLGVPFG